MRVEIFSTSNKTGNQGYAYQNETLSDMVFIGKYNNQSTDIKFCQTNYNTDEDAIIVFFLKPYSTAIISVLLI